MVHVFRLGPFEAGRRKAYAYGGVDESGNLIAPTVEHTDEKALAAIASRHAGQPLRCEPSLAKAAQRFGFEPVPLPESALLPRATLAYGLAHGPAAGRLRLRSRPSGLTPRGAPGPQCALCEPCRARTHRDTILAARTGFESVTAELT